MTKQDFHIYYEAIRHMVKPVSGKTLNNKPVNSNLGRIAAANGSARLQSSSMLFPHRLFTQLSVRSVLSLTLFLFGMMVSAGGAYAQETDSEECRDNPEKCGEKLTLCNENAVFEYQLDKCTDKFRFRPHKKNYIVFGKVQADKTFTEQSDNEYEANFQISVKVPVILGYPLNFAYTQKSFWILTCCSQPFRQNNYNPELFWDLQKIIKREDRKEKNWQFAGFRFGLIDHESNGREDTNGESRGWNRFGYVELKSRYWINPESDARLTANIKVWPWSETSSPNNVDMEDYYGNGEISLQYEKKKILAGVMARKGDRSGTFSYQLDLGYQPGKANQEGMMFYAKYWSGVGESLYEYNKKTSRLLIGFLLAR